jgi:hypothetical protein
MGSQIMKVINFPIIDSIDEGDYRKIFEDIYLNNSHSIQGFPIKIFREDFEHICYEPSEGGIFKGKFSLRRARKILAIKEICLVNIPFWLIHQLQRENKSVCVLCESIEFALYLVPKKSAQGFYFRIGTIIAFGKKVEEKIEKQKQKGVVLTKISEVFTESC